MASYTDALRGYAHRVHLRLLRVGRYAVGYWLCVDGHLVRAAD